MRGKKWDKDIDAVLIKRYPHEKNKLLSEELGYGIRTIVRHARELGLYKSKELLSEIQLNASREGARWFEYMRITGQRTRIGNNNGKLFQKGRVPDPEIEKKRIAAIRETAWTDRKRIIHGLPPKTKWRFSIEAYDKYKKDNE